MILLLGEKVGMKSEKISAIIESVQPLSDGQQTLLADEIKKTFSPQKVSCYFCLNPALKGGIKAHFGSVILDDSVAGKWQMARRKIEQKNFTQTPLKNIPDRLLKSLFKWRDEAVLTEVGHVESVQDGVAHITGLPSACLGEKIVFECGACGIALNLNEDSVDVCLISGTEKVQEEEAVYRTHKTVTIPTGFSVL